ncbi:CAI-1 autoinducer synthase [Massilia sp. Bi118]|uniref:alpha-hydroxyketone-type quorum-sensing autoinducer synthase n=1 Tax=Massilia sp. Bi118 TaxID=2822346 RepID=UPI001D1E1E22|nr:alpha-hydroxyketone-type quorum-sensing autoinducer synthase [Massilia sp. Bi118]CAH0294837.1 CAI-1 autoinducer synthase [Massilia sp. Bi118]
MSTVNTIQIKSRPTTGLHMPAFVTRRMDAHHVTRIEQLMGGEHVHVWKRQGPGAVMLAGNDYLCLANEPVLLDAQARVLTGDGGQSLMSAVYLQAGSQQHRLEEKFADFMGAQETILAQSGWAANVGLLQSISEPGVPVYLDIMAHASLWDGVTLGGGKAVPFLHNNMEHLERQLNKHGAGVIVVDALYSTDGSLAPLHEVVALAERTGSVLVVDESHSLGTHGPRGAGLVIAAGLEDRVHFRTASLAKAFAGRAGIITCSSRFKPYFLSESRPAIFSSCMLNHELAWFDAAIDFVERADARRAALRRITEEVRTGLGRLGYCVDEGSEQIIALEVGTEPRTLVLRKALENRGIQGAVFCAPATPKNRALVRLTLNAGLTKREIARLLAACADMREEVDLDNWTSTIRRRRVH